MSDYQNSAEELAALLGLATPPISITFCSEFPQGMQTPDGEHPAPTEDGRTGAVPASCVFWVKGAEKTFATSPADHGNCSVGSLTHGLIPLAEAATRADVQAICEAKWVDPEIFPSIPTVTSKSEAIVYGPLAEATRPPDVVLLRLVAKQAMQLHAALPTLRFKGKPQCHIIPIAKDQNEIAISVGCMLSRVRTGMSNNEMTCAIPGGELDRVLEALRVSTASDRMVAAYAAEDSQRFR